MGGTVYGKSEAKNRSHEAYRRFGATEYRNRRHWGKPCIEDQREIVEGKGGEEQSLSDALTLTETEDDGGNILESLAIT